MKTTITFSDGRVEEFLALIPCPMIEDGTLDLCDSDCTVVYSYAAKDIKEYHFTFGAQ